MLGILAILLFNVLFMGLMDLLFLVFIALGRYAFVASGFQISWLYRFLFLMILWLYDCMASMCDRSIVFWVSLIF